MYVPKEIRTDKYARFIQAMQPLSKGLKMKNDEVNVKNLS